MPNAVGQTTPFAEQLISLISLATPNVVSLQIIFAMPYKKMGGGGKMYYPVYRQVPEIIDPVFAKTSQNARFL
jgi:hypothetical protein